MLGQLLKDLRERAGLTLAQVGAAVGVKRNAVWKWEKGSGVTSERLAIVLTLLGATDDERLEALRLAGQPRANPDAVTGVP